MNEHFLGIVQNGGFLILTTPFSGGHKVMLTAISMQAAERPEGRKLDLREYEGSAIMVKGHASGQWIYSAEVVEKASLILTELVKHLFGMAEAKTAGEVFIYEETEGEANPGIFPEQFLQSLR
ncbi:MAG: hypothetical protein AB4290_30665 [Spirulina sp.]